ncbi:MAG TPA: hypothetical protein DIS98_10855 [Colwellia sp.]|nr:hypothetical protein [Colwellia sp.]|tara:strand:+ start:929 stop:1165 length:237 start_codon:yes stop_codon:yes gene_type:complete
MLSERISNSGHWRFDIQSATLDWSVEIFRIHGLTNKSILPYFENTVDVLREKDRAKFRSSFHNAIYQQHPFHLKIQLT